MKLDIPKVKRESFANRSFSVMGQRMQNDVPSEENRCVDVESVENTLKTFLFNRF